jgi:hypothetical protein
MWERFSPHADDHFLQEIQDNFISRYWEMFVGCCLMDRGFTIRNPGVGPDFEVSENGALVALVECIAPGGGTGPDFVPEDAPWVPQDGLVFRYTGALREKATKHAEDIEQGLARRDAPFVVAINPARMPLASAPSRPSRLVRAFYGGHCYLNLNPGGEWIEAYEHTPSRQKRLGSSVRTDALTETTPYPQVSAVLCGLVPRTLIREASLNEVALAHNAGARLSLARGWLGCGQELWLEGRVRHVQRDEHGAEHDATQLIR